VFPDGTFVFIDVLKGADTLEGHETELNRSLV